MAASIASAQPSAARVSRFNAAALLTRSAQLWFIIAAIGQIGFVLFILGFFGSAVVEGDISRWNDKPHIDAYKPGDTMGNVMYGAHAFFAAMMTGSGLLQLIPAVRRVAPRLHRISGRTFAGLACLLALGGLWLVWVRGTYLSLLGAWFITIDAGLILWFAAAAVKSARAGHIMDHRRWALRLFMVAHGVWFMRISIMAWILLARGPVGMNKTMTGPTDIVVGIGCYMVPLILCELYMRAKAQGSKRQKASMAAALLLASAITALGVFGTTAFMWLPNL